MQGKFCPHFIYTFFAFWLESKFKTGLVELFVKDYVRKLENGRIQILSDQMHAYEYEEYNIE